MLYIFWRLRNKNDGYRIQRNLMRFAVVAHVVTPAYSIIIFWEAFENLPHYVGAFRVLENLISMNYLMFIAIDWLVYLSFNDVAQRELSSISLDPDHDREDDDGERIHEV